jgi:methionyl-tRNA formyltransferase
MMRIVFMGSDAIALPLLNWLAGDGRATAQLVAVYTQPDRAAGRGQKVQPGAIKQWAESRGLPVHQPAKLGPADLAQLQAHQPDVVLVMAYGHILRPDFIGAARQGTLNLHASLLPKYRGASPIQSAIAHGERTTGVTLMRIVPELDAGPVADIESVPVDRLETAADIETKLAQCCVPLVARALPELAAGRLRFVEQDSSAATFCRRLDKSDGQLDFKAPAATLAARINGLFPWPACSTVLGGQIVKLGLADVAPPETCHVLCDKFAETGAVIGAGADPESLLIATGEGVLRIRKLQRPGGKMLPAGEFLRGFPVPVGTILPSHPMSELVAATPFPRKTG